MKCAVMQPTFLPWAGYFRLMEIVDRFVYLNDVQRVRQSWQTRNRILVRGEIHWLVAPLEQAALTQTIADSVLLGSGPWRRKLGSSIRHAYARHPFFSALTDLIEWIENGQERTLGELNIGMIELCVERLGVSTPRQRASAMRIASQQRTDRLAEICRTLSCDCYVSPIGAADYLMEDRFEQRCGVKLVLFDEVPPPYRQYGNDSFVSHLSIVDVVANLGWGGARDYIESPWLAKEIAA